MPTDVDYKELNTVYVQPIDERALWKPGTTLIIGDSILYGIDENRLRNTKVRVYPGSTIEDMFFNITPLLRKRPTNIFLHVGSNNTQGDNSIQIIEKLIRLKSYILTKLPSCKLVYSSMTYRFDDGKAQLTVEKTNNILDHLGLEIIDHSNITDIHIGKKGLHLNSHGTGKLAVNFLKALKNL